MTWGPRGSEWKSRNSDPDLVGFPFQSLVSDSALRAQSEHFKTAQVEASRSERSLFRLDRGVGRLPGRGLGGLVCARFGGRLPTLLEQVLEQHFVRSADADAHLQP